MSSCNERDVAFENHRGLTLRGVLHEANDPKAVIILVHGLLGSAFGSSSPRFAKAFCERGFTTLRFDLSCTNRSDGNLADKRMSEEAKDIGSATDFIETLGLDVPIVVHGHSTGAIDAALYAHTDERIAGIVLNAGVSDLTHTVHYDFTDAQIREFQETGMLRFDATEVPWYEGEWFEGMHLDKGFYDEFFELDLHAAVRAYQKPLLIIHGSDDEAIPADKDPHELYAIANEPKEIVIVQGADHRYLQDEHFEQVIDVVERFITTSI